MFALAPIAPVANPRIITGGLFPSVAAGPREMPVVRLQIGTAADVRAVGGYEKRQHDFRGRSPAVRKHLVVARPVAEMLGLRDHRPVFEPLFHESPLLCASMNSAALIAIS